MPCPTNRYSNEHEKQRHVGKCVRLPASTGKLGGFIPRRLPRLGLHAAERHTDALVRTVLWQPSQATCTETPCILSPVWFTLNPPLRAAHARDDASPGTTREERAATLRAAHARDDASRPDERGCRARNLQIYRPAIIPERSN